MIMTMSLSARRAWIEISKKAGVSGASGVALRKESVDRNDETTRRRNTVFRRSPQGERG